MLLRVLLLMLLTLTLEAHQLKENYLKVDYNTSTKQLRMTLEVETRVFEQNSSLDDSHNGIISYKELRHHQKSLLAYTFEHFTLLHKNKALPLHDAQPTFHRYKTQTYMQLDYLFNNIDINDLVLHYSIFFDKETGDKLLINISNTNTQAIIDANHRSYHFSEIFMSQGERFRLFVVEGIKHILDGTDHLLFLAMLIVAIVLTTASLRSLVVIITSFALAHSLTLFIAGMGWYVPNPPLIESGIALSIFIVALLNIFKKYNHVNYKISFAFGLLHGFGFANVLHIAGVDSTLSFLIALFGFNIGVELGQLSVIALAFPTLLLLRRFTYHKVIFQLLILATLIISGYWFAERIVLV